MELLLESHLRHVSSPANLLINDQIGAFRKYCLEHGCRRPYHHFAFGQSPFPPPPTVVKALKANASKHSYLPTAGLPELREAIAAYYRNHFELDCDAKRVIISPGSKEMIAIALSVLQGEVLIPIPSWVSYLPQAKILKKPVAVLRTRREDGFRLTPALLERGLKESQTSQKILILNHPNNPTGAMYSEEELLALAEVCRTHNVFVISDEIYALTAFEPDRFVSMGRIYPEGTLVTGGLSKDRSSGGYRFGVGIIPKGAQELTDDILKVAGSTYSCVAAPIQYAAIEAYSGSEKVERYIRNCAAINAVVGKQTAALLNEIPGVHCAIPQGAFYIYVDFNDYREPFRKVGLNTCPEMCEHMLQVEHTAFLPGSALLLPEDDFSVRCSFVDFDGAKTLKAWRWGAPSTPEQEAGFLRKYCPLVVDGVGYAARFLEQVREGKRPEHL
jgi:aspartate/methionine/tyrosine aminotransferase